MPEILTARDSRWPRRRVIPAATHWIEYDQPSLGRRQKRAICGDIVESASSSSDPTCVACRERMIEIERMQF